MQGHAGAKAFSHSWLGGKGVSFGSFGGGGLASSLFAAVLSIPHALAEADCVSEFVCPQFGLLPARARE